MLLILCSCHPTGCRAKQVRSPCRAGALARSCMPLSHLHEAPLAVQAVEEACRLGRRRRPGQQPGGGGKGAGRAAGRAQRGRRAPAAAAEEVRALWGREDLHHCRCVAPWLACRVRPAKLCPGPEHTSQARLPHSSVLGCPVRRAGREGLWALRSVASPSGSAASECLPAVVRTADRRALVQASSASPTWARAR